MFGKAYCINYHTNCDKQLEKIELKKKAKMPELPTLEKEGYKFVGWFLDEECTKENDLELMPKNDVDLYAKWEAITLEEFLRDINFYTKSSNILKSLQNDYEGVPDFKDPKPEGEEKEKKAKKTGTKKTASKKSTTKKSSNKKTATKKVTKKEAVIVNEEQSETVEAQNVETTQEVENKVEE